MIAFLVLTHADPQQHRRLVASLAPHPVFVHLGLKTPLTREWRLSGAVFVEPRVPVYWAGFSQIEATLSLIKAVLGTGADFDRLVLLSGSCYPIQPISRLERHFADLPGLNFIRNVPVRESDHLQNLLERRYRMDGWLPWRLTAQNQVTRLVEKALRRIFTTAARPFRRRWKLRLQLKDGIRDAYAWFAERVSQTADGRAPLRVGS
jgi:hypothetical protein